METRNRKNNATTQKPRSPGATRGEKDEKDTSSDEDSDHLQNENSSFTSSDNSYLKIAGRQGLRGTSHRSNVSQQDASAHHQHSPKINTSATCNSDGTANDSYSPSKIYPSLEEFKETKSSSEVPVEQKKGTMKKKTEQKKGTMKKKTESSEVPVEQQKDTMNIRTIILIVLAVVILCLVLIFYIPMAQNSTQPSETDTISSFDRFLNHVSNLEKVFPNQNQRLWKTVKASSKHVLNDSNPGYPAVILMASPVEQTHLSKCIATKITSDYELVLNLNPQESTADISKLQHLDPASQKQDLDGYLHSAFNIAQRKSFIIDNLQLLHPEAALMLHGYCDNDNAPYKDVMIVLLLHIDNKDLAEYNSAAVEYYLEQLWNRGLDIDKVKALLSRVVNNLVIIEAESDETFKTACP